MIPSCGSVSDSWYLFYIYGYLCVCQSTVQWPLEWRIRHTRQTARMNAVLARHCIHSQTHSHSSQQQLLTRQRVHNTRGLLYCMILLIASSSRLNTPNASATVCQKLVKGDLPIFHQNVARLSLFWKNIFRFCMLSRLVMTTRQMGAKVGAILPPPRK